MTDLPTLKLKTLVCFPATVVDGTGIDVIKSNGSYRFDLDFGDFAPPVGGISDAANQTVLLWNAITGQYALAPVALFGIGGVVPEAPVNGTQYGRQNASWTPVIHVPAGTLPPLMDGVAAVGVATNYSREDHRHPSDTSKANLSHTHPSTEVTDFNEAVDDRVAALLVPGANIGLAYDDLANTLTINSTGGGGGGGGGDVFGPAGAVLNRIAVYADSTGKIIKDGGKTIAELLATGITDGDKGDITVSGSGAVWTIDNDVVTFAKMQNIATDTLIGRDTAATGDPEQISVGGGIEFTGTQGIQRSALAGGDVTAPAGSAVATIVNNAVTNPKLADMAQATIKGRQAATGTGDPEDLTPAQAATALGLGTAAFKNTGASGNNVPLLDQDNTWTGTQGYDEVAVTPTTPITWNVDAAPVATVALNTGATTMSAPTNVVAGRVYTIRFANNATPGTVAWNAAFHFSGGVPTITALANAVDRFTFIGRASNILEEIGRAQVIA